MFAASLGGMTSATYSGFYGRRLIYLAGIPFLTLGSIDVALSRNVPETMVWRFIQAFGTSGGMSVGAAVIGDIYKVTERGSAMGIFFGATLLGPALAPLAGGRHDIICSRWTQAILAFAGFAGFVLMLLFLPETSHPGTRGIDKMHEDLDRMPKHWTWVWLNPLAPLALLCSPLLLLMTFVSAAVLIAYYALFVPIAYTIGAKYNITNEFIIGACFLPGGIGNITFTLWSERHWQDVFPTASSLPLPLSVPSSSSRSLSSSGLITQYIDGKLGLVLNLICFFVNGVGVNTVLTPLSAYMVDIMHSRSAEVMAASTCSRAMILSVVVAFVLPLIKLYGVAIADGIISLIGWSAFVLLWVAVRYGKGMRGWVDIGFSTAADT
ncbi:uncharacterized protein ARMOST_08530 [Armillaria ostoyae]|uniref:Major facilitator superfamily (MFS) profile domain-containing protein n=1 Tax=Armillaria ostoyae TaxID=47428 RepID=A0A284R8V0_ARMOS|nr:uncharacterized protein ARMOST_08530 [Armillaria ostoyae]